MITMMFILGAIALYALGSSFTKKTSARSRSGGAKNEKRRQRQLRGTVLKAVAALSLVTGILNQVLSNHVPEAHVPPASGGFGQPKNVPFDVLMSQAFQLVQQKQFDDALDKVNAALQVQPQNPDAHGLRGIIYAKKERWSEAREDYQTVLKTDSNNVRIRFDVAEIDFRTKDYALARPGFFALRQDPDMGDLAAYKVFLCDLFGGHESDAAQELDAFNQVGSNASYYFANASWSLYHHKTEEARGWLISAAHIYSPNKFELYAVSLHNLGYLPLPPLQH